MLPGMPETNAISNKDRSTVNYIYTQHRLATSSYICHQLQITFNDVILNCSPFKGVLHPNQKVSISCALSQN